MFISDRGYLAHYMMGIIKRIIMPAACQVTPLKQFFGLGRREGFLSYFFYNRRQEVKIFLQKQDLNVLNKRAWDYVEIT